MRPLKALFLFQDDKSGKPCAEASAGEEARGPVRPDTEDSDNTKVRDIGARPGGGEVRRHGGNPNQDGAGAGVPGVGAWGQRAEATAAALVPAIGTLVRVVVSSFIRTFSVAS